MKRAADDDPLAGRFLLTGSMEADLTSTMWPGAGRVVRVVLDGLTRREIAGTIDGRAAGGAGTAGLLVAVVAGDLDAVAVPGQAVDLDAYVRLALVGGFPEPALRVPERVRAAWFDSYLEHVVTRDVAAAGQSRDPVRLRRYLETLALSTAGLPTEVTLFQAAGIDKRTAEAYDALLSALYLLDLVPAWASNRITRLVKRSKRYLVDPALAMSAARLDEAAALADPDLLGRLLDTFVTAQLRPEIDLLQPRARLHHLRTEAGRQEIDLVVDLGAGRLVGIEVKAASAPTRRDARHLAWLRDQVGTAFVRGVIFHTGPHPFELDERTGPYRSPPCGPDTHRVRIVQT